MVGSYLIRHLSESGYKNILGIKRESSDIRLLGDHADKITWKNADIQDITDWDFLKSDDIIVHTAAIVSLADSAISEMYKVNIQGTENIVNAALHAGIKKLVYISSIAALGRKQDGGLTSEEDNYDPESENGPYNKSKYAAERQIWRGQQEGLDTLILNPSVILGAGFWKKSSAVIIDRTAQGIPFFPKGSTGFVDIRDVAIACRKAIETNICNERIIINGFNSTYENFFQHLTHKLRVKMPSKPLPDWLGNAFWRWERIKFKLTGIAPAVTKHTVNSTRRDTSYDNQKSIDLLGMKYYSMEESIDDITNAYLNSSLKNEDFGLLSFRK